MLNIFKKSITLLVLVLLMTMSGFSLVFALDLPKQPCTSATPPKYSRLVGLFAPGMRSEQVRLLQEMLASDPAIEPKPEVNGHYDEVTISAVQSFQRAHNILSSGSPETNAYGWAGPLTRATMNIVYGGAPDPRTCVAETAEPEAAPPPVPPAEVPDQVETADPVPPTDLVVPAWWQALPVWPAEGEWTIIHVARAVTSLLRP